MRPTVPPVAGNWKLDRAPFSFAVTATWLGTTPASESLTGKLGGSRDSWRGVPTSPPFPNPSGSAGTEGPGSLRTWCHPTHGARCSAPGGSRQRAGTAPPEHAPQTSPPGKRVPRRRADCNLRRGSLGGAAGAGSRSGPRHEIASGRARRV